MNNLHLQNLLMDQVTFKAWLTTKQPNEKVGVAAHCGCCPLANFIMEQKLNGGQVTDVRVNTFRILAFTGDVVHECAMPSWVSRFIDFIDTSPRVHNVSQSLAILALKETSIGY